MKTLFREVLPLGGFTNKPIEDDKPVAKLYLDAQAFLTLLVTSPQAFAHKYDLDAKWMAAAKIDLDYFKGRAIEPLLRRAAKRFAMMRLPEYDPPQKSTMTTYLMDFLYNRQQCKSWFLFCVFNEPVRVGPEVLNMTEEDKALLLKHKKADWNESVYLNKGAKLLEWYRANIEGLTVYNTYVMDAMAMWYEKFGTFSLLLDSIDAYSQTWDHWTPGHFGVHNKTWDCFVKWVKQTWKLEIDPDPQDVKAAFAQKKDEDAARKRDEVEHKAQNDEFIEAQRRYRKEVLGIEEEVF